MSTEDASLLKRFDEILGLAKYARNINDPFRRLQILCVIRDWLAYDEQFLRGEARKKALDVLAELDGLVRAVVVDENGGTGNEST
jgi:hypothetical protein